MAQVAPIIVGIECAWECRKLSHFGAWLILLTCTLTPANVELLAAVNAELVAEKVKRV